MVYISYGSVSLTHHQPNVQYETQHPAYAVLQAIGKEITQKVKPKALVVFSAHWQAEPNEINLNNAEDTDLIYEYVCLPPPFPPSSQKHTPDYD